MGRVSVVLAALCASAAAAEPVLFNRDIRPILSDNCYKCHGPGNRQPKGGLHLHVRAKATSARGSRPPAIRPGKSSASVLIARLESADPDDRMPPPSTGRKITAAQIDLLKRWIDSGAIYEKHWAFNSPRRPTVPGAAKGHPIDGFVHKRLKSAGLRPARAADRRTLIRRVSLDLTGLPPDVDDVRAFDDDQSRDAYKKLVDRLLASPHYGERMAQEWMDAARYADTSGFAADAPRTMHHYRDWIIQAFNSNMPFDQFTIEQLAGDMLPHATQSQIIATGFHRNSMQALGNNPPKEEFRVKGIVDRLDTTGRVWLGLTLACAECHDHKFDPVTQREYYQLFAIFTNIPHHGQAFGVHGPRMSVVSEATKATPETSDAPNTLAVLRKAAPPVAAQLTMGGPSTAQVMVEMAAPRKTFVHVRGNFENRGEQVSPGVPKFLGRLPAGMKADRLSFAKWLVDGNNPLVARVIVNRLWQQFFGTGLVRTVEDFGRQGEWPSHPELLDWLAVEFVESGWDVRHIVKLIVTSQTYQQISKVQPDLLEKDFYNRLLARGPRYRLAAEQVRDNLLTISGLLHPKIGGPSAYPVQPSHIGEFRDKTAGRWNTSRGDDRYRRGLYTFWQRMYPYPSLAIFDAPARERSCVRRSRSNTPLQALVLLNDPVFFEAARAFGGRILLQSKADTDAGRIQYAFEVALSRPPAADELKLFMAFVQKQRRRFAADPEAAKSVVEGRRAAHGAITAVELATWTLVGSTILSMDETISVARCS